MTLATCKKTSLKGDYFIFGSSYGECSGSCVNYYLLKKGNLYSDDMSLSTKRLKFKNDKLPSGKADLANHLKAQLPTFLKNSSSERFGCPDCHDQGAYFIELSEDGITKSFHLDTDTGAVPIELRTFVVNIESTLRQL